ncbi:phage holin family protein [Paracoccus sp. MC1862]|uniref:phage holin family protein n=1 Tax=Paracoccus sp. MC1862 TaxID=2760307 RepID=UPI001604215D|nr:phage holin family protein [Paracoccus sp. MC1862]MBB1496924.1 phage holin family protein [Paracoccus sp. MC1862]QQO45545.1 phage holin family protein [Paracoccus sp. MC1862]
MFDYARNMQLALSDAGRRVAMKAAAGAVFALAAGFLLAALWTFLARNLGWGPLGASLAIGLLFVILGVVLLSMSKKVEHPVPSTDELKAEVETRLSLATDAALEKARVKATEVVDTVENKVHTLMDNAAYKAEKFASDAEAKVQGFTRNVAGQAAQKVGLTPGFLAEAQNTVDRVKHSDMATIPPLLSAFAIGIAIANRVKGRRQSDERHDYDPYDDDDQYRDDDRYV